MAAQQLYLFGWLALIPTTVVTAITRATFRRVKLRQPKAARFRMELLKETDRP